MAKKNRTNEQRQQVSESEFIPLACHFDPNTLLTKNGELLQTIKITGFTYESVFNNDGKKTTLRRMIRTAIAESFTSNNYALWIHTVRRKKNLNVGGQYRPGSFEEYVHQSWVKRNDWENKYVNELYITVVREGESFKLHPEEYPRSFFWGAERKKRMKFIEEAFAEINAVGDRMLTRLQEFGARRLTISEYQGVSYSEPMQFFGKIINLVEEGMPAPISDISEVICTRKIAFGHNLLEVKGEKDRYFGAMLTVKEYHEVSSTAIDRFLQLDQEFIITETFDFISNDRALESYEKQKEIIALSNDKRFAKLSGMEDVIGSLRGKPIDFGEHQISIMLFDKSIAGLEAEIRGIFKAFGEIGIVAVREDLMMEDAFWAQLPGNFPFLRRLSPISSNQVAGFASLYNFPAGKIQGNYWGAAVALLYTKAKTPYFFNFHDGDNGHTSIIGPFGAGKTVLLNFLTSEARKFNNRLFFFDQQRASELFLRAIGGDYKRIMKQPQNHELKMNPLRLPDTPQNRSFLRALLLYMAMDDSMHVSPEDSTRIHQAVDHIYLLAENDRRLANVLPKFWPVTGAGQSTQAPSAFENELASIQAGARAVQLPDGSIQQPALQELTTPERLAQWYGNGKYAHLFDNPTDEMRFDGLVYGFGMTEMVQEKRPLIPVLSYLLHRIKNALDGTPTMLVLDEAWSLIDNPVFAPHVTHWLDDMRKHNCMVVLATESVEDAKNSSITKVMMDKMATRIFLPNPQATQAYNDVFGLSDEEFVALKSMRSDRREFLLKHHLDHVIGTLDLSGMHDIIAVLSGSKENVSVMSTIMLDVGTEPDRWLPIFRERVIAEENRKNKGHAA
ncbi:MAG: hypothetical protein EB060_01965 [Proteobacteria bacterium]|nr:hypothetical protein [Pseudomonadota bacterium]